ncbi:MAG: membrane protein insertion efficiency factor YidD [Saprospiraceae bacterium]
MHLIYSQCNQYNCYLKYRKILKFFFNKFNTLIIYILIIPIKMYQKVLSPFLGANCRFTPTCSHYMIEALREWGPIKGLYLGLKRIGSCHPWGGFGDDPVPKRKR